MLVDESNSHVQCIINEHLMNSKGNLMFIIHILCLPCMCLTISYTCEISVQLNLSTVSTSDLNFNYNSLQLT